MKWIVCERNILRFAILTASGRWHTKRLSTIIGWKICACFFNSSFLWVVEYVAVVIAWTAGDSEQYSTQATQHTRMQYCGQPSRVVGRGKKENGKICCCYCWFFFPYRCLSFLSRYVVLSGNALLLLFFSPKKQHPVDWRSNNGATVSLLK